ncbi:MAG: outer membrane lipoprotein chaperone LolA [Acidobacteria bacterium]|nr:outer membrane lipoprotein chaperone LolA [Acidobacteriota bacterium]
MATLATTGHKEITRSLHLPEGLRRDGLAFFVLFFTVVLSACTAQAGSNIASLADAIQSHYDTMRSFKADFVQIYRSAFSNERESGVVYMKKPGKMRWEYTAPTQKLFITDGQKTYFYVPHDKQVTVGTWQVDSTATPLLFLLGQGNLRKDFDIGSSADAKLAGGDIVLLLTPKTEQAGFKEVLLEVREKSADVLRLSVIEHNGNRNDYVLRSFQQNTPVAEDKFQFKVPNGVEIITEDQ